MTKSKNEIISENFVFIQISNPKEMEMHLERPDEKTKKVRRCDLFCRVYNSKSDPKLKDKEYYAEMKRTYKVDGYDQLIKTIDDYSTVDVKDRVAYMVYRYRNKPKSSSSVQRAMRDFARKTKNTRLIDKVTPLKIVVS